MILRVELPKKVSGVSAGSGGVPLLRWGCDQRPQQHRALALALRMFDDLTLPCDEPGVSFSSFEATQEGVPQK